MLKAAFEALSAECQQAAILVECGQQTATAGRLLEIGNVLVQAERIEIKADAAAGQVDYGLGAAGGHPFEAEQRLAALVGLFGQRRTGDVFDKLLPGFGSLGGKLLGVGTAL